jgi:hypothetical protein
MVDGSDITNLDRLPWADPLLKNELMFSSTTLIPGLVEEVRKSHI